MFMYDRILTIHYRVVDFRGLQTIWLYVLLNYFNQNSA